MSSVSIHLLGALAVSTAEGRTVHFRTDKIRALLAYLLMEYDRPHQRASLAALLWPEMPQATAMKNLRQSLHRMQKALDAGAPQLSSRLFTITRQTVALHSGEPLAVDAWQIQRLLAESEAHQHRHLHLCDACVERLAAAAALYRGELLQGFSLPDAVAFEEWLLYWRERLQQRMVVALGNLTNAYIQRGELDAAYRSATQQIALDPFREEARRQLVRLLAARGEHAGALAQIERYRTLLQEELGVAPSPEMAALAAEVEAQQRGEETAPASAAPMIHFPAQFTPFVGRERELQQIEALFAEPECRLVTVVGRGGMGKTRLTIRAAEMLAGAQGAAGGGTLFEAVYFIGLAGDETTDALLAQLMNRLDVAPSQRLSARESVVNALRLRRCLLVLDNFEQLVDSAELLAELLAEAPGLRLLVSSHTPLQLGMERRLLLEGLDYPPAAAEAGAVTQYGAGRLFVEAARQAQPSFRVGPQDGPAIVEICRLLEGMPLALELAAAWVRVMDCAQIAREVAHSSDFLSLPARERPQRHQSMAAVFDYSWRLMSPEEQEALQRMAVFRGPFSLEAIYAVTQVSPLTLARLVDRALVRRGANGFYELHGLLRQFAAQHAAANGDETARRHGDFYLALVAAQEEAFYGPRPDAAAAPVLNSIDNVRRAWQWAIENHCWPEIAGALEGLGRFYQTTGRYVEGEAAFGLALEAVGPDGSIVKARLLIWRAYFLEKLGRYGEAVAAARQAEEAAAGAPEGADGFDMTRAAAQSLLSKLLPHKGQFEEARELGAQAIAFFRRSQGQPTAGRSAASLEPLARALRRMAIVCWRGAEYEEALRYFREAIPLHQALGHKAGLAQLYSSMAGVFWERREIDEALQSVQRALALYEEIGDRMGVATAVGNLSILYRHNGQYEKALQTNAQSIAITEEMGDRAGLATDWSNRGHILYSMGDFDGSLDCQYRAMEIDRRVNNEWGIAYRQSAIAASYQAKGDLATALTYYEQCLPVLLAHGAPYYAASTLLEKVELLLMLQAHEEARAANAQARALCEEIGLPGLIQQSHVLEAQLDFMQGEQEAALQTLHQLLAQTEDEEDEADLYYTLWRLTQDPQAARQAQERYARLAAQTPSFENRRRLGEVGGVEIGDWEIGD